MAMSKSGTSGTDNRITGTTCLRPQPATVTCQAMATVKGKPCRCDQPATATRLSASGGRAVCLKHDRAVWIEYVKASLP
jgi:hypothetical protein